MWVQLAVFQSSLISSERVCKQLSNTKLSRLALKRVMDCWENHKMLRVKISMRCCQRIACSILLRTLTTLSSNARHSSAKAVQLLHSQLENLGTTTRARQTCSCTKLTFKSYRSCICLCRTCLYIQHGSKQKAVDTASHIHHVQALSGII